MKNKTVLLSLVALTLLVSSGVAQRALSQAQEPLTKEASAPQPVDTAAARAGVSTHSATPAIRGGGIAEWFARGGIFMWPILICSIVASIFIIERAYTLFRARTNSRALMTDILTAVRRDGIPAAERVCEQTRGPIAAIVHSGLRQANKGPEAVEKAIETAGAVEMSFLERGLIWLATISTVAPLLGFLGTVSGMIHAFDAIAAADQVSAKLVAGGISEALITTEAGLIVAIPASLAHNLFLSLIDRFVVEMEESSSELVNTIVELH